MVHKKKKKILIDGEIFESNEVKKYLKEFLYSKFVDKKRRNEIIASLDCRNNKEIFIDGLEFNLKISIEILPTNIYDESGKFVLEKRNENKKNSKVIQELKKCQPQSQIKLLFWQSIHLIVKTITNFRLWVKKVDFINIYNIIKIWVINGFQKIDVNFYYNIT